MLLSAGDGRAGQLGRAGGAGASFELVGDQLPKAVAAVALGGSHCAALLEDDGAIFVWGEPDRAGLGADHRLSTPQQLHALRHERITAVGAGAMHTAAGTASGDVFQWGAGPAFSRTPTRVAQLRVPVEALSCGALHTLLLVAGGGGVYSFGSGRSGALGHGDEADVAAPRLVPGLPSPVAAVAAGGAHSLALAADGRVFSWGDNRFGQLGRSGPAVAPAAVVAVAGGTAVACGDYHSLVVAGGGALLAAGGNECGQLGLGDFESRTEFEAVWPSGVTAAAGGGGLRCSHTLFLTADGALRGMGSNKFGQLGLGLGPAAAANPTPIPLPPDCEPLGVACGWLHSTVLCRSTAAAPAPRTARTAFALLSTYVTKAALSFADAEDLSRLACACTLLAQAAADDEGLWRPLFEREFRAPAPPSPGSSWKRMFVERRCLTLGFGGDGLPFSGRDRFDTISKRPTSLVPEFVRRALGGRPDEYRVLMQGLDSAGKTTMLYKLMLGEVVTTIPTIGLNVETVDAGALSLTAFDWGQQALRPLWRHYYQNTQAIVVVVDSNDRERIDEEFEDYGRSAREHLFRMLSEDLLQGVVLLVFANKQDLPDAMSVREVAEKLQLQSVTVPWYIQGCCATSGQGLREGLAWLTEQLSPQ